MEEQTFKPGDGTILESASPTHANSAFFEDDGDTGYFYAIDLDRIEPARSDNMILDAVHIYNVATVSDRDRESSLSIVWSDDGMKCALLINGYPHGAFDFGAKRGYCRTDFPNSPKSPSGCWDSSDHHWSNDAVAWLK